MSDIEHISRSVEEDRARLAQSLNALSDTVNPRSVAEEVSAAATNVGSDLAQKAWHTLRDNPAGGLLVAVGMGLLANGTPRQPEPREREAQPSERRAAIAGFDARVAEADAEMRAEMTGELEPQPEASKLKAALETGLDKLPPKARARVIKARQAAIAAQESIERQTHKAARKSRGFVHEQPLAAGALALGFGVVFASLLPGTRREDALMGRRRDALMADARNALEEEMQKVKEKAEQALTQKSNTEMQDLRSCV